MAVTRRPAPAAAPARRAAPAQVAQARGGRANGAAVGGDQQFASLNPEDFSQGGLLDDMDVLFTECRFVEWDYDGAADKPALCLLVTMQYEDQGKQETSAQYYSAGDLSRFIPSEDGTHAVSVAGAKGLNSNTNCAILLKSVIEQGFPADKFGDGDVSAMDGMSCHINRIPQPKRGGAIQNVNSQGYERTVAIVTKINHLPWETKPASPAKTAAKPPARGGAPTPAARQTAAAAQPAPDDLSDEAAGILLQVLEDKNGSIKKASIAGASFKHLAGNANRSGILQLLADPDFLGRDDYGWAFDGTTVESAG